MQNHSQAKAEFTQRIEVLEKEMQPALVAHNLKEIVIYEKLMEIQEQLSKLEKKFEKYNEVAF